MYPSGIDGNEEFLSLYLHMAKPDGDASLQNSGVVVEVSLSIKDKVTSNRNIKTGLSLVPAPTVTWSRCSDRYDYLCCSMNLGYVLCASRPVPVPSDRGLRWLGMGKVHGDEVCEGLVPREGQLLNWGRCCHRWIIQDGIGIIRLLVCVCRANIRIEQRGFCFVCSVFLNSESECGCTLQNAWQLFAVTVCCEVALLRPYIWIWPMMTYTHVRLWWFHLTLHGDGGLD